jgi:hypothetical protein
MRFVSVLCSAVLTGITVAACTDTPTGLDGLPPGSTPSPAIAAGETFSHISITSPSTPTFSMEVASSRQMSATLHYSAGGTLASAPYAQWRSSDECIATVTNASPSWGLVRAVTAGTTRIIAEAWGRADTVTVTVTGSGNSDPGCYERQWIWDYEDVSFTGAPAKRYRVRAGEKVDRVVLFAAPRPDYTLSVGRRITLRSELWYDQGGRLNGRGFVVFSTTDGSVATITPRGVVTALQPGRTKIIARLGSSYADTIPLHVR